MDTIELIAEVRNYDTCHDGHIDEAVDMLEKLYHLNIQIEMENSKYASLVRKLEDCAADRERFLVEKRRSDLTYLISKFKSEAANYRLYYHMQMEHNKQKHVIYQAEAYERAALLTQAILNGT